MRRSITKLERIDSEGEKNEESNRYLNQTMMVSPRTKSSKKHHNQLGSDMLLKKLQKQAELKPFKKGEEGEKSRTGQINSFLAFHRDLMQDSEPDSALKKRSVYKEVNLKKRSKKTGTMRSLVILKNVFETKLHELDQERNSEKKKSKQIDIIKKFIIGAQSTYKDKVKMIDQVAYRHQLIEYRSLKNKEKVVQQKAEKVDTLVKLFITKLKSARQESILKNKTNMASNPYDSTSLNRSKNRKESGMVSKEGQRQRSDSRAEIPHLIENDSLSRQSVKEVLNDSPRNALNSPNKQSGFSLARPLLKRVTSLAREGDPAPTAHILFERNEHAKRITARFHYKPSPGPVKASKEFKIFPLALEHDLSKPETPQNGTNIQRHRKSQPTQLGSYAKNSKSPSELDVNSQSRVNFTSKLNRMLVNSRVKLEREMEPDRTEKQKAIDEVINDRALTPSMKRRKVQVIDQLFRDKEDEKRKQKEENRKKELEDALKGKR